MPAESDAALTPTRQAKRVERKRRTFLSGQRALRAQMDALEEATHGAEAVEAARARGKATPPMRMRAPNARAPVAASSAESA